MNGTRYALILMFTAILAAAVSYTGCVVSPERSSSRYFRFVIINNTSPDSPYADCPGPVKATLARVSSLNPVFIMHTGNIIHGGFSWMGVRPSDMHSQYKDFYGHAKKLSPLLYTTIGPLDTLNGDHAIYREHTGYGSYYSFNYASTHFIVLDSTEKKGNGISGEQYMWLSKDLSESAKCRSTIVFMYHSPLKGKTGRNNTPEPAFQGARKLHALLSLHDVTAVFSSDGRRRTSFSHENVQYYQVPCHYPEKNRSRHHNQYYVIDARGEKLDISGHSIY